MPVKTGIQKALNFLDSGSRRPGLRRRCPE
jgi:hypothetical protein